MRARRERGTLHVAVDTVSAAWRPICVRVAGYDGACKACISTPQGSFTQVLEPHRERLTGAPLDLTIGTAFVLSPTVAL